MTLREICNKHGLTPKGVDYALMQYQTVICEITHGMLSKLTYDASIVIHTAQERWCDGCDIKNADTRENVHGKWIKYPSGELICSKCCHRRIKNALGDRQHWFALPKFCEACGAVMDGGDEP